MARRAPRTYSRALVVRLLALSMALTTVTGLRPAHGDPGDIFSVPAPAVGEAPPKDAAISDGDSSVSTMTGAFQHSYPIHVPPGRQGMEPHLALSYSSQGPIYGTIAAGWSLSIPLISQDTSQGRLAGGVKYSSSLSGGRQLIPVTEPKGGDALQAFRAQNDTSFIRYEQINRTGGNGPWWRAYSPDGNTYYFGDDDSNHAGTCSSISHTYAPLTRVSDLFGNLIEYRYESANDGECRIAEITWGQNANAGVAAFASAKFDYTRDSGTCGGVPVGSQTTWRTGVKLVTGASQLDSITITAYPPGSPSTPDHTRVVRLVYSATEASCTAAHAAYRQLTSIQESAWGTSSPEVDLPAVTFGYGPSSWTYPTESTESIPWSGWTLRDAKNLSWGFRPASKWPTVEAMLIDIDGDGLVDRLISDPYAENNHTVRCRASWQRNRGSGSFDPARYIELPTLKWSSPNSSAGGAYANANGTLFPYQESCSLNYQQTKYLNSSGQNNGLLCSGGASCPTSGYCPESGMDCTGGHFSTGDDTILSYRWMDMDGDGLTDLVASPAKGGLDHYNLYQGDHVPGTQGDPPIEPPIFGPWANFANPGGASHCPAQPYSSQPLGTYTMCGGMYPWFVYKNHGNGVFGLPPTYGSSPTPDFVKYQPIALEGQGASASVTSSPNLNNQGSIDIDGDGYLDAISASGGTSWSVYLNDHTGQFIPASGTTPFSWSTTTASLIVDSNYNAQYGEIINTEGLYDINGDGLVDAWKDSGGVCNVKLNDGLKFRVIGGQGEVNSSVRPANDGAAQITLQNPSPSYFIFDGIRHDLSRVIDLDADGRADVSQFATFNSGLPSVYFNQGGQFGAVSSYVSEPVGLRHSTLVELETHGGIGFRYPAGVEADSWEVRSDMVDLDGDGIAEAVNFSEDASSGVMKVARVHPVGPRLLTTIANGRGSHTTVTYAPFSDTNAVTQDPSTGKTMPRSQWVVKTLSTVDDFANASPTTTTTGYHYSNPRFSPDDEGKYAFRGFETVTTTLPSTAIKTERFSYSPDWSGRLTTTLMQAVAGGPVHTIDETQWEARTLFAGAITTYHGTVQDHWVCKNGQDESSCRANTDTRTRTVSNLAPLPSSTNSNDTTTILLWQETSSQLQAGATLANGDRITTTTYVLDAAETRYHLVATDELQAVQTAGVPLPFAKSRTVWTSYRVPEWTETWVDAVDANRAIEHRVYDMATGNLLNRYKPVQNAASTTFLKYDYDARKLFVIKETNELGHVFDYLYEYGTGTKLETSGPNVAPCSLNVPPNCPAGTLPKDDHRIKVDGLGRTLERWDTFSDDGGTFTPRLLEILTYVDTATSSVPTSVTHQSAIDFDGNQVVRYAKEKSEYDGHGRQIRKTAYVFGTAPTDAVTTYHYRNDGTLAEVLLPDPTANNTSTVTYTYTFDTLGRPTGLRRPDNATASLQSGVDISYDGLTQTTTEVAGGAGGQVAVTTTHNDAFGRLIQVDEERTSTPVVMSVTTYSYGPDDEVATIVDPEGVTTSLTHDWDGRRTQITRAGRSWNYGYDKNGNMVSVKTPCSPSPLCDPSYTTTIAYDDLDRPASKVLARRNLSTADVTLFGADHEGYTWDYGNNHKGRLRYWFSYAPGQSGTNYTQLVNLGNNAQGLTNNTEQVGHYDGINVDQLFYRTYNLANQPATSQYRDNIGGSNQTSTTITYDARGLPLAIVIGAPPRPAHYAANQTRNVAGLVTKRRTDVAGSGVPMTFIESNWTYDKLGRVSSQVVQKGPGPVQVVRQDLTYFGNDDPKTLDHWLGPTNHKLFNYSYDLRHQLTGVTESALPNAFTATYSYGAAGRFATATESAASLPGSDVRPRDVNYVYAGADPEQVTSLTSAGSTYASYAYDDAGNQITRSDPATTETLDFLYDGKDQLRRVTKRLSGVVQSSQEYWYDHTNRRIAILKRDASGTKTELIAFNNDAESHFDTNGAITHVYCHASMGTPVARVNRTGNTTSDVEYQFHGLANNTLAAVDRDTGGTTASFDYAPFGEVIEATDGGAPSAGIDAHRRRANDKYVDDISALAYYGFRYYDRTSMLWTQSDPSFRFAPESAWKQPRRAFQYEYSLHNPLRYLDPDGFDVVLIGSQQPKTLNLTPSQIRTAAGRSGSFTTMSSEKKATSIVGKVADVNKALAGRKDAKVAYFGHGRLDSRALDPSNGKSDPITPEQFAKAIKGMAKEPTDVYLYGCDTDDTGFAEDLAKLLPGVTVHGYAGDFDVEAQGPKDKKGKFDKSKAVLNPTNSDHETKHTSSASQGHSAPADADGNGNVSDEEESSYMRQVQ
jgi:RHS repeat-associated protein